MGLFQHIQRSLERNIDAEKGVPGQKSSGPDWRELLERLERKVRLAAHLSPAAVIQMPPSTPQPVIEQGGVKPKEEAPNPEAEENKRSLDRVAYLGGIFLPITIVTGILSMNDTFGPTGDKFYVFWAVAVPLTLLALAVIYADSIRRVEVWIEEAHSTYDPAAAASGMLLGMKKKKPLPPGAAPPTWSRLSRTARRLPSTMAYPRRRRLESVSPSHTRRKNRLSSHSRRGSLVAMASHRACG
ncbi:hypothetical protein PG996_003560 [Apiospora saccharicola]|uniref:Uncharacterized protein n=1 Tax=Apiospora saccharicola TaxID=335842 RepID=A0ABR1W4J2_9PEZI